MNNEQQQIIDEAYLNYLTAIKDEDGTLHPKFLDEFEYDYLDEWPTGGPCWFYIIKLSKDEFIDRCKTDPEFSEKWGLTIEERELSLEERHQIHTDNVSKLNGRPMYVIYDGPESERVNFYDEENIPTKLITITRELNRDERIELYNKEYGIPGSKYESPFDDFIDAKLTTRNIPTNEIIESYE